MIQSLYDYMIAEGGSAHHVRKTHKALHVALQQTVELKIIPSNPVASTSPPKPKSREMEFYDDNQVQSLLLTAQEIGDRYYPLYYLAIHTGMRHAELLGLKWSDLDWEKRTISVQRQLLYRPGGKFEFSSPKTTRSKRSISLGLEAVEALRVHKDNQWQYQQIKGDFWTDQGLIFPSAVGTPVQANNLRRSFRHLIASSGLPKIRFHDLRHTAASLMLNYGTPVIVVSERLGHSKASITLDVYGHLIPSQQVEAARLMDELMTPVALLITPKLHRNDKY